jgi:hypothetical protein
MTTLLYLMACLMSRAPLINLAESRVDVSADIMERVDPVFYGAPMMAALKALGMN